MHTFVLDISLEPSSTDTKDRRDPLTSRELLREVEDNAEALAEKLSAFEGAWHVVGNACSQLSADLELANGFTAVRRTIVYSRCIALRSNAYTRVRHLSHKRAIIV